VALGGHRWPQGGCNGAMEVRRGQRETTGNLIFMTSVNFVINDKNKFVFMILAIFQNWTRSFKLTLYFNHIFVHGFFFSDSKAKFLLSFKAVAFNPFSVVLVLIL
jgi:hypothetical protein